MQYISQAMLLITSIRSTGFEPRTQPKYVTTQLYLREEWGGGAL
jgi:hypothetical protein